MTQLQYLMRFLSTLPEFSQKTGRSVPALALSYGLNYILLGANSEEFRALHLYELAFRRRREFLFCRDTIRFSDRLNAGATAEELACFDVKHRFNETFRDFVRRDWLYVPDSGPEDIRAFLGRNGKFLAKDDTGTQGKSIFLYDARALDPDAFIREYQGKPFLLEAFIDQHPDAAALNPSTVNTLRIQTIRKDGRVELVGGCIRCGGADAYVDNFHKGGVGYPLDMETGVVVAPGRRLTGEMFRVHPSTGRFMPGFQVPLWDQVTEMVRKASVLVPHIGYVGWDVALTPDGPELIEANINYPDPIVVQLDDRGVRRLVKDFVEGA